MIYFILIFIAVLAVGNLFWMTRLEDRAEALSEQADELEKTKRLLDQRFLESARKDVDYKEVYSSYTVTESDALRYNTEEAIFRYARKQIAANIAHDIIHNVQPVESVNAEGMKVYSYTFQIK